MTYYLILIETDDKRVTEWNGRTFIAATKELIRSANAFGIAEMYQVTNEKAFKTFQQKARVWRK